MQPDFRSHLTYKNVDYRIDVHFKTDFPNLKNISQVYGVILNENNEILLVYGEQDGWILPGGSIEPGETLLDTLHREVYEEAAVIIDKHSITPLFYQDVFKKENKKWIFDTTQVRYFAKVKCVEKFKKDPDGYIRLQKFVQYTELHKYLLWGGLESYIINLIDQHAQDGN